MPILPYVNRLEPSEDAVIWRFMDMRKFRDFMASEELYFSRADKYDDQSEGLPPDEYALPVLGLNPLDVNDQQKLNNLVGFIAQHRESYYISCWHLFCNETLKMWAEYAKDGLAICSRYELLKHAVHTQLDTAHLGLIQYGIKHLTGFNTLQFITTKQMKYAEECEVRAFLNIVDPLASGNRHIDANNRVHRNPLPVNTRHAWVPDCKRRRIDLQILLTGIVMSPWATSDMFDEVKLWVKLKGHSYTVQPSALTNCSGLIPSPDEFKKYGDI